MSCEPGLSVDALRKLALFDAVHAQHNRYQPTATRLTLGKARGNLI